MTIVHDCFLCLSTSPFLFLTGFPHSLVVRSKADLETNAKALCPTSLSPEMIRIFEKGTHLTHCVRGLMQTYEALVVAVTRRAFGAVSPFVLDVHPLN